MAGKDNVHTSASEKPPNSSLLRGPKFPAGKKKDPRTLPDKTYEPPEQTEDRDEELCTDKIIFDACLELYREIEQGFEQQYDRSNEGMDFWDIFNCKLSSKQYYAGTSKIFVPIVHDAVNARVTRFTNQIFPSNGRYIEVVTMDGDIPHGEMSLVEYYIKKAKLRTVVVPALLRNGDIEGQYNVYVSWKERKRHVVWKKPRPELIGPEGEDVPQDIVEEELIEGRPHVEVLADSDVLVLPFAAETMADAIDNGGSVTVLRRWSKSKIRRMIEDGDIEEEAGETLLKEMAGDKQAVAINKQKVMVDAAGIKSQGSTVKHALVYETWTMLTVNGERRICRIYFGSERTILGCKRNPYWSDRLPIFSCPVDKVQGVFKGKSKVTPCEQTQYYANDIINEAADSSMFSMMPIVMTDPERNPRVGSMVLSLAAIWECDPNSTVFAKFPDLWKAGFEIVASCKAQIMQSLSVSPAAITQQQTQKAKPSQADIAREQQVDILTTADAVTIIEEGILTPIVNFFVELDHQYRDDDILIPMFGERGLRAKMDWVPPIQLGKKLSYRWFGVEQARTAMQLQQQIAFANVLFQIPQDKYPGHRLNMVPLLTHAVDNIYGPRLAPLIFEDEKEQLTVPAETENEWMVEYGVGLPIHPMDEDVQHLQVHSQALQATGGDPTGNIRMHMARHQAQLQLKQQAAMQQQVAQMMGGPGSGQPQGRAPRAGGQSKAPRGGQGPAGMVHRDQIGPASGSMPQLRRPGGM
jgi:hypothetical protein